MAKNNVGKPVTLFRSGIATAGTIEQVSLKGGKFGAGYIRNFAVITRGEALGHGLWIDKFFVQQVETALAGMKRGAKARFTHPDMSADGLSSGLGRVLYRENSSVNQSRGDLHFWKTSRKTPDGDLAGYLAARADEDPESFGASIVFMRDLESERELLERHGAVLSEDGPFGPQWDFSNFESPDDQNSNNLPHARLGELRGVDIVDDPAANPDGLFYQDQTFQDAEALLGYLTGETTQTPELVSLGVDPERVGSMVTKFLDRKGLKIVNVNLNDAPATDPPADEVTNDVSNENDVETQETETPVEESTPEVAAETTEPVAAGDATPQEQLNAYIEVLGKEFGTDAFLDGTLIEQAKSDLIVSLRKQLDEANEKLAVYDKSETEPFSMGGADGQEKSGGGLQAKIEQSLNA